MNFFFYLAVLILAAISAGSPIEKPQMTGGVSLQPVLGGRMPYIHR